MGDLRHAAMDARHAGGRHAGGRPTAPTSRSMGLSLRLAVTEKSLPPHPGSLINNAIPPQKSTRLFHPSYGPSTIVDAMLDPYLIEPPFSVSFSGGSTSGFMLRKILDAYGGSLPTDARVCFANTGMEHPKTLEFVNRVATEWGVDVVWLEYDPTVKRHFKVVDYESASRDGEPFETMINYRGMLPNPFMRFCTHRMKVRCITGYLASLGWKYWDSVVGLRADEPRRVAGIRPDRKSETIVCPMHEAGHTLEDVERFWDSMPWKLEIPRWLGNCVGCFLKSRGRLEMIAEHHPEFLDWWIRQEEKFGQKFGIDNRPSYNALVQQVTIQGRLFEDDGSSLPCTCTE